MTLAGLLDLVVTDPAIAAAVAAVGRPELDLTAPPALLPPATVVDYPAWETLPHERLSPRADTVGRRLAVLRRLRHPSSDDPATGEVKGVVAPVRRLAGARAVVMKPRSYMNASGGPVASVRAFFAAPVERVVVVHDELDIPYGTLRLKLGGGDNGHNGLRSVTASLGTRDYLRVRFGIGRPPGRMDPADFVLRDFSAAERKELPAYVERAADAVESLIADGLAATQNAFHAGL